MTSRGRRRDRREDIVALAFGHAGGGLVEQQHARLGGDRDRDLEQALLAVGQRRGQFVHDVEQMEAREIFGDLGVDVVARAHHAATSRRRGRAVRTPQARWSRAASDQHRAG